MAEPDVRRETPSSAENNHKSLTSSNVAALTLLAFGVTFATCILTYKIAALLDMWGEETAAVFWLEIGAIFLLPVVLASVVTYITARKSHLRTQSLWAAGISSLVGSAAPMAVAGHYFYLLLKSAG